MNDLKLLNIGFGNLVSASRLVAIISPDSAPVKRMIQEAREKGQLIDASCGRRTRAVLLSDSGHIILSAIQSETIAGRLKNLDNDDGTEMMDISESEEETL